MPRRGRRRRKSRTHVEEENTQPIVIVARRGKANPLLRQLVTELRLMLYPNSPLHFKETSKSSLKDLLSLASHYEVNNLLLVTETERSCYLKLVSLPEGPTVTFEILEYTLSSDVKSYQRHPVKLQADFKAPPLLITKGKMPTPIFHEIFPKMEVQTMALSRVRRVALIYKEDEEYILRHYFVKTKDIVSKSLRLLAKDAVPNLNEFNSVGEWLNQGCDSDSEAEEPVSKDGKKVSLRLTELGPRIRLKLHKIQSGVCEGEVTFHSILGQEQIATKRPSKNKTNEKTKKKAKKEE